MQGTEMTTHAVPLESNMADITPVLIRAPGREAKILLVSFYAPHRGHAVAFRLQWWMSLFNIVSRVAGRHPDA